MHLLCAVLFRMNDVDELFFSRLSRVGFGINLFMNRNMLVGFANLSRGKRQPENWITKPTNGDGIESHL